MTNIPAGWYPDPSGTTQQRWWDGTAWTEHYAPGAEAAASVAPVSAAPVAGVPAAVAPFSGMPVAPQPYSTQQPIGIPTAPEGTQPYTPWIWALALLPILSVLSAILGILTTDIDQIAADSVTNPLAAYTPATIIRSLFTWVIVGAGILFAILDYRELVRRGVQKPFHWAFVFFLLISAPVYLIGRSIVIRRRVGTGLLPIAINIPLFAILLILGIVASVSAMSQVFDSSF